METNDTAKTEILQSCYDYFYRLVPGIEKLVESLRQEPEQHLNKLADACEGVLWLASALSHTQDMHDISIDFDYVEKNQRAITDGMENRDYEYVAETLEFEVLPLLQSWFEALDAQYSEG